MNMVQKKSGREDTKVRKRKRVRETLDDHQSIPAPLLPFLDELAELLAADLIKHFEAKQRTSNQQDEE